MPEPRHTAQRMRLDMFKSVIQTANNSNQKGSGNRPRLKRGGSCQIASTTSLVAPQRSGKFTENSRQLKGKYLNEFVPVANSSYLSVILWFVLKLVMCFASWKTKTSLHLRN